MATRGTYRDHEEVEAWEARDPIPRFRDYLVGEGVLSGEDTESLAQDVEDELDGVWEAAEERMEELGGAEVMFEHVCETMPESLAAQAEAFDPGTEEEDVSESEEPHGSRAERAGGGGNHG